MSGMLPIGDPVAPAGEALPPSRDRYQGKHVTLSPIRSSDDASNLFACSHGSDEIESLWTYMGYGPFCAESAMAEWLAGCAESDDPLFLSVTSLGSGTRVGMVSFLNIVPDAWRLELGHIWYAPSVQRTKVNTESVYLMLRESFGLGYRRIEWKCDALNAKSRAAALRLGFKFEGIFRQHLIYKGRNRNTAWFSMLDAEWPRIRQNIERWLYENDDGGLSLTQLNAT